MARSQKLARLLSEVGITPCNDNSCMFGSPGGMATNGGCRCIERNGRADSGVRVLIRKIVVALRRATDE